MNVLGEILEEIRQYKEDKYPIANKTTGDIEEIIRSHMDEVTNADAKEKSILCTVGKNEVLTPYDDTYDIIIHCLSKEDQDKAAELIKSLNWIPVSERLPDPYKTVCVTIHCSEWISDYDSNWVPEDEKVHHEEDYIVNVGCVDEDGYWTTFNDEGCEDYCDVGFGTDKGRVYSVVTAWKSVSEPYKGE